VSISGWSRLIALRSDRGRHRRGSSETSWEINSLEVSGQSSEHLDEEWLEPPTGLRKFNLGTIPASVTPPRTWRRAAWFAGGTAAFVACALGLAAIALNGHTRRGNTIEALPGQPSQRLTITDLPVNTTAVPTTPRPSAGPVRAGTPTITPGRLPGPAGRPSAIPPPGPPAPADDPPGAPALASPAHPQSNTPFLAAGPVAPAAVTPAAPKSIGTITEQYFQQVVPNPRAACELTGGRMRQDGAASISRRYAGIARIEIRKVLVDRAGSMSTATLLLVLKDGRSKPVERRLTFSPGPDPRIVSDTPAG
jgi:hypothetical protein